LYVVDGNGNVPETLVWVLVSILNLEVGVVLAAVVMRELKQA